MRKILIFIVILTAISFWLGNHPQERKHKVIKVTEVLYPKHSPVGITFGCYKEIRKEYDCQSKDTILLNNDSIDENRSRDIYVNEFGDTILIQYLDYRLMYYEMNRLRGN